MEFRIERADVGDYRLFSDIIQTVWQNLDKKEWFVADDAAYTYEMLESKKGIGYKALAVDPGEVVGVFMAAIPGVSPWNLGYDVGMEEARLLLVAHMESVAILPGYRGHKLQYRLMQAAETDLRNQGFRYLMCTVHPDNCYSRNNVVSQGYKPVMVKEKYGGYLREIFLKDLG